MLDYNTLNNLVEIFKKNGIKNIELESGSTIEVKEGALLVNGEGVGASYTAGDGISINEEGVISNTSPASPYYTLFALVSGRTTESAADIFNVYIDYILSENISTESDIITKYPGYFYIATGTIKVSGETYNVIGVRIPQTTSSYANYTIYYIGVNGVISTKNAYLTNTSFSKVSIVDQII